MQAATHLTPAGNGVRGRHLAQGALRAALFRLAAGIVVAAGLSACSGGTDLPTSASAVIGAAGGTLVGPDGVQVVVPAGALSQSTTLSIARSSVGAPTTLPEDNPPGPIYEFLPHGLVFSKPVTIRMQVPGNATGSTVFMASPGQDWQAYGTTVAGGFTEWPRNSFSWMFAGNCQPHNSSPYSASNPDPYPCVYPAGSTTASATVASDITAIPNLVPTYFSPVANNPISWVVNQATTVQLNLRYAAAPDCQNARVKLIRWDPAAPLSTPNRVTTVYDQPVVLTPTTFTQTVGGSYVRGVGNTIVPIAFSYLDNITLGTNGSQGTHAFGYSFSCNRPLRPTLSGGDVLTFIAAIPVPSVTYTIGGAVSGLSGAGLVLQDNGGDNLAVAASGSLAFATAIGSGAPYAVTVLTQPAGQTCTVTNGSGTANANVTNVAVNCVTGATGYSIGGTVSGLVGTGLVLQNNGADNLSLTASGAFSFATPVVAGGSYSVSVLTQPSGSTCTVSNGTGTANANVGNVAVTCTSSGSLALVANSGVTNGTNGLSVYRVSASTGALSFLSSVNAGNAPYAVAITPNGLNAYVSNQLGDSVSSYSVDSATGVVSLLGSRVSNNASGIAMDRLGRYIWVANYGWNTVQAFAIGSNGVLAAAGAPLATTSSLPYAITAHPTLDFVYVAHQSSNFAVSVYSVNPASGALTLQQTVTNVIVSPTGIVIDPSGR
ncbi:beta-propeller fold lactonase family protein, partial [Rhodoferax sp. UBA5149]|uniref:beta-propeller fold lactonase family protein n=1 Tax=Rhodoferax sp. UBA5149 TaxID=1947379 RepID=UPI0025D610FF